MGGQRVPFSITISGPDKPGLLANMCDILTTLECHIADVRIAQLVGECIGILVIYAPPGATNKAVSDAFDPIRKDGLHVCVNDAPDDGWVSYKTPWSSPYMVSYEGADRPGIMSKVAHELSAVGCHFMDVSVDSSLGDTSNAFILVCEVEAPLDRDEIDALVSKVGKELEIELTVMPANMDDL